MTIQRLYSLPNCTLLIEGLGDTIVLGQQYDTRVPISMLINAECRLNGQEKPLSGGREFLESLVTAVSQYTQVLLSGLHTTPSNDATQAVQLERINETTHRLIVRSQPGDSAAIAPTVTQMDLNTVQLFDLVEAIDQLLADTQTLPNLTLNLQPISRREAVKERRARQHFVPAAIGVSGLATATVLLSLLPVPKVEQPENLYPVRGGQPTSKASPAATAPPSPSATSGSPSPSPVAATSPTPSPTASGADRLTPAAEITDTAEVEALSQQLQTKLDQTWSDRTGVTQDLTYQVGVRQDGAIAGYKAINPTSLENAGKTPLLNLLSQTSSPSEPMALFKVVFTGSGTIAVAPWRQVMTSPISGISEITDNSQLEAILPKLRSQINQNWAATPSFEEELIYKVRVQQDGTIVDYSPENEAAARYVQDTPLAKLAKPIVDGNTAPTQQPVALFKLVMRPPDGSLEISPWRGWQN